MASIYWIAYSFFFPWYICGLMIYTRKQRGLDLDSSRIIRSVRWYYHETKPFVIPLIVAMATFCPFPLVANAFDTLFNIWAWFVFKDVDKDDRWKKRMYKAKSKVEISNSRLIVVPE